MNDSKGAIERWEGQVDAFKMSASYKELTGIDGEPIEFEWNIFPGCTSLQMLHLIQNNLQKRTSNLRSLQTGSSSCQCSTTLTGQEQEMMDFIFRI